MSKLPDYVTKAINDYRDSWTHVAQEYRDLLEAAIERYAHEKSSEDVIAEHSGKSEHREWCSQGTWLYPGDRLVVVSGPKLIEENPDTLPPFIDNPPPIG